MADLHITSQVVIRIIHNHHLVFEDTMVHKVSPFIPGTFISCLRCELAQIGTSYPMTITVPARNEPAMILGDTGNMGKSGKNVRATGTTRRNHGKINLEK
jgi:hypothetical protein